mmetsp:Transcript_17941/g.31177  ORF Transcript_17941/g.31177 Transcript_17941/m.31177 type:complete len:231 (+) Transcript_17941:163-855(+)
MARYERVATTEDIPEPQTESARIVEQHVHHHYYPNSSAEPTVGATTIVMPTASSATTVSTTATPQEGFLEFVTNSAEEIKAQVVRLWESSQPWKQFFDVKRLSFPIPNELVPRVQKNFEAFKPNYGVVMAGASVISVLYNPIGLALFALCAFWIGKKIRKLHEEDPSFEQNRAKVIGWSVLGFLAFLITGVGPSIMGALSFSGLLCGTHALVYQPAAVDVAQVENGEQVQ